MLLRDGSKADRSPKLSSSPC